MSEKNSLIFKELLILFVFIVVSLFLPLSNIPLFDLDEGAFSEATREMLLNKNFITTYLNGELRFDKPILIYWFQSLSVSIFGLNEFALRLPSSFASLVWMIGIYLFTSKYYNRNIAFISSLIFISSLQINIISKAATADALLNMFIALSMFCFYHYYQSKRIKYLYLTFFFTSLGVLTKGPVAILVPFVSIFIFLFIKKEYKFWFKSIFNLKGIILFLIVALPWYILEYLDQGQLFIDGFFLKHNLSRFNSSFEGHSGSYFYFIPVLLFGLIPYTSFLVKSFFRINEYLKDELKLFLLIWFIFVFIFFSFSNTKLPHYIIYGYTPLFILIALTFIKYLNQEKRMIFLTLFFPVIVFLFLFLFLPYLLDFMTIEDDFVVSIKDEIISVLNIFYQMKLIVLLGVVLFIYKCKIDLKNKLIAVALIFIIAINYVIVPVIAKVQQEPIKNIAMLVKKEDLQVYMYKMNNPSFNVYSKRLVKKTKPEQGNFAITKKIYLKDFKNYQIIYEEMGIVLIKVN